MLNYGFLPKRRPPLLCAYDLGAPEAVRPLHHLVKFGSGTQHLVKLESLTTGCI